MKTYYDLIEAIEENDEINMPEGELAKWEDASHVEEVYETELSEFERIFLQAYLNARENECEDIEEVKKALRDAFDLIEYGQTFSR